MLTLLPANPPYVMEGYIGCCFFSLPGYRHLGDGGTDRREILHRSQNGKFWV